MNKRENSMTLTRERQQKARAFVRQQARPLDQCLLVYYLGEGAADDVLFELGKYQNADGGFGHALEPDLRLPDSSAIATTVGLQILRALKASGDHPLVQGAMRYLLHTYDAAIEAWPIIPPHDNTAPHAPWWRYDAELSQRWAGFRANPRAEIVGYLWDYSGLVPEDLLERLTSAVVGHLETLSEALEIHDLLCYVRLAETQTLPEGVRTSILQKLRPAVDATVLKEPSAWDRYGLKPLEVAPSPDSPFADLLAREIELNLDYEIQHHQEDGSWAPTWSWGEQFPEAWKQAEREWKGCLTMRALRRLQNYGRLE
jgi:hypothetical protein